MESYKSKLYKLKKLRHLIKRKKILVDESKRRFGSDEMVELSKVKNTSQVKGYPFKLVFGDYEFAIKLLPIETRYEKSTHPVFLENIILKELTENIVEKQICPHIVSYIGSQKISNKSRSLSFLELSRLEIEKTIKNYSNMLLSEYVSGGSLDKWIGRIYDDKKTITDIQWKSITFQLIYTILVLQKKYKMMHNDFHYGNILIDDTLEPTGYFVYRLDDKTFYIPNTGVIPKLWDFEFSMVYSDNMPNYYPNKFIIGSHDYNLKTHTTTLNTKLLELEDDFENVPINYNEVYDLHYFLTSLLDLYISEELFQWIINLYPRELIPPDDSTTTTHTTKKTTTDFTSSSFSDDSYSYSKLTENSSDKVSDKVSDKRNEKSSTDYSSNSYETNSEEYLEDGRIITGKEKLFTLPTPLEILNSDFFKEFSIVPDDFDESDSNNLYFDLNNNKNLFV